MHDLSIATSIFEARFERTLPRFDASHHCQQLWQKNIPCWQNKCAVALAYAMRPIAFAFYREKPDAGIKYVVVRRYPLWRKD